VWHGDPLEPDPDEGAETVEAGESHQGAWRTGAIVATQRPLQIPAGDDALEADLAPQTALSVSRTARPVLGAEQSIPGGSTPWP